MEARHDLQHRPRQQARTTKDTDKEKKLGFWKIRTGKKQYTRGHAPYRGCINIRMTLVRRIAREREKERERESLETVRETKHMENHSNYVLSFFFFSHTWKRSVDVFIMVAGTDSTSFSRKLNDGEASCWVSWVSTFMAE